MSNTGSLRYRYVTVIGVELWGQYRNDARPLALMAELQPDLGQILLAAPHGRRRKAVAANPRWWPAHHVLGIALCLSGRPAQGIEASRQTARMAPDTPLSGRRKRPQTATGGMKQLF